MTVMPTTRTSQPLNKGRRGLLPPSGSPPRLVGHSQEGGRSSCQDGITRVQGQVRRAPVWARPRNKGVPVAAQPCCLLEHRQNSPRSVSGRYPGDTRGSGRIHGQKAGRRARNTKRERCPGPYTHPGHPRAILANARAHTCVGSTRICSCGRPCMEGTYVCALCTHMHGVCEYMHLFRYEHTAAFNQANLQPPILGSALECGAQGKV